MRFTDKEKNILQDALEIYFNVNTSEGTLKQEENIVLKRLAGKIDMLPGI